MSAIRGNFSKRFVVLGLAAVMGVTGAGLPLLPTAWAEEPGAAATEKGTISGVVTKDGQPLANVKVALMKPPPPRQGGQGGPGGGGPGGGRGPGGGAGGAGPQSAQPAGGDHGGQGGQGGPGGGRGEGGNRPPPIAETTTDAEGKYTFKDVAVGDYVVVVGDRQTGMGRQRVTVKANATAEADVKVQQRGPGGPGGGQGGPAGGQGGERPGRGQGGGGGGGGAGAGKQHGGK
jgi:hypothetical protein